MRLLALCAATLCAASLARGAAADVAGARSPDKALVTATSGSCVPLAEKHAHPPLVRRGATVDITLHLAVPCAGAPTPFDAVLLIDRSTSMKGAPIAAARDAALAFVDEANLGASRIGVVSFAGTARVDARLAKEKLYLRGAIQSLEADGGTDIAAGLREAARQLALQPVSAAPVVVLLTDGFNRDGPDAVRFAAAGVRAAGATLITIAVEYGADVQLLAEIATTPADAYVAPKPRDIAGIYARLGRGLANLGVRELRVVDELPPDMEVVPDSARPAGEWSGAAFSWSLPVLGADGVTLTYRVRPTELGLRPTNVRADATYREPSGAAGGVAFPVPVVEVVDELPTATADPGPSPTPVVADTPTPRLTPQPPHPTPDGKKRYLPALAQRGCPLTAAPADLIVVLDASTTMLEPTAGGRSKLSAALVGTAALVEPLSGPGKRMGIVAFNADARLLAPLGTDEAHLRAALEGVVAGSGSRIDLGLARAQEAFAANPGAQRRFVVLITDGRPVGASSDAVIAVAEALKSAGVTVHVAAVGTDADRALLGRVASPGALHDAGDGEGVPEAASAILAVAGCSEPAAAPFAP